MHDNGKLGTNCAGLKGWWWNDTTSNNFANKDTRILCSRGRFYSPGSNWGGQAYAVDQCVQKGSYYSKGSGWVKGDKKTDAVCAQGKTSMAPQQATIDQLAAVVQALADIVRGMMGQ